MFLFLSILFIPQRALPAAVGADPFPNLGGGAMLFLEKQTAEVVGIVKAKGVRDLFDRKLGGAKQLDGVHRLAFIDILEGRHSHMLFEKRYIS